MYLTGSSSTTTLTPLTQQINQFISSLLFVMPTRFEREFLVDASSSSSCKALVADMNSNVAVVATHPWGTFSARGCLFTQLREEYLFGYPDVSMAILR